MVEPGSSCAANASTTKASTFQKLSFFYVYMRCVFFLKAALCRHPGGDGQGSKPWVAACIGARCPSSIAVPQRRDPVKGCSPSPVKGSTPSSIPGPAVLCCLVGHRLLIAACHLVSALQPQSDDRKAVAKGANAPFRERKIPSNTLLCISGAVFCG